VDPSPTGVHRRPLAPKGACFRKNLAVGDRLVQAIVLVSDLVAARRHMEALGFIVLEGGHHPGRGTANVIVPFGHQYLELLAVVDRGEAMASPQGRPIVTAMSARGPGLARWSVEPEDIEATARRVGLGAERRFRVLPTGETVRWRSVGVDRSWIEPWRCAFMAWDEPHLHPARSERRHPNGARGFSRLEVATPDRAALVAWLGGQVPGGVHLSVSAGSVGPIHLFFSSPIGEIPLTAIGS
jgi:glyoxalase-like protein